MSDTITISRDEYDQLKEDSDFLGCLEQAGVDSWDGYDFARELFSEANPNAD